MYNTYIIGVRVELSLLRQVVQVALKRFQVQLGLCQVLRLDILKTTSGQAKCCRDETKRTRLYSIDERGREGKGKKADRVHNGPMDEHRIRGAI